MTHFGKHRDKLTAILYRRFNEEIFLERLAPDMHISWSSRLLKTAGRCLQFSRMNKTTTNNIRYCQIELSSKVLDSAERLRDTLLHEMCHAASWVISGCRDGHGKNWKDWTNRCITRFPELPIIESSHSYDIRTKFTYKCSKCDFQVGRHTMSLNVDRKACGRCRGRFEVLVNLGVGVGENSLESKIVSGKPKDVNHLGEKLRVG